MIRSLFATFAAALFLGLSLGQLSAVSVLADAWQDASKGQSSFLSLGPDFSVPTPVRSIAEGSRVVLLRRELANQLGLTGADLHQVAQMILERFAVTTEGAGDSPRRLFATRYQDYGLKDLKELGNAEVEEVIATLVDRDRRAPTALPAIDCFVDKLDGL